jgi:hypothetical protein
MGRMHLRAGPGKRSLQQSSQIEIIVDYENLLSVHRTP